MVSVSELFCSAEVLKLSKTGQLILKEKQSIRIRDGMVYEKNLNPLVSLTQFGALVLRLVRVFLFLRFTSQFGVSM